MAQSGLIAASVLVLTIMAASEAISQPRGSSTSGRSAPAAPPSGHQSEAIDLNEGKSAAELFQAGCAVCHQSAGGLAKGRSPNELVGFLRQHYTSSVQHAGALAAFLTAAGPGRGAPATATPNRQERIDRPPAPVGSRRPPADEDAEQPAPPLDRRRRPAEPARPQEANRPPEREAPAKRKPVEKPERPAAAARTAPQAPAAQSETAEPAGEPAAAPAAEPPSAPPPEEKPAAPPPPQIPL